MSELVPISKEEAKEALERAAWEETPTDAALSACYDLACWLVRLDDPEDVLAREERRSVTLTGITARARAAVGLPLRRLVHCFSGTLGADHELRYALEIVDAADEVGWDPYSFLDHDLRVRVGDRVYVYAVRRPPT